MSTDEQGAKAPAKAGMSDSMFGLADANTAAARLRDAIEVLELIVDGSAEGRITADRARNLLQWLAVCKDNAPMTRSGTV